MSAGTIIVAVVGVVVRTVKHAEYQESLFNMQAIKG